MFLPPHAPSEARPPLRPVRPRSAATAAILSPAHWHHRRRLSERTTPASRPQGAQRAEERLRQGMRSVEAVDYAPASASKRGAHLRPLDAATRPVPAVTHRADVPLIVQGHPGRGRRSSVSIGRRTSSAPSGSRLIERDERGCCCLGQLMSGCGHVSGIIQDPRREWPSQYVKPCPPGWSRFPGLCADVKHQPPATLDGSSPTLASSSSDVLDRAARLGSRQPLDRPADVRDDTNLERLYDVLRTTVLVLSH